MRVLRSISARVGINGFVAAIILLAIAAGAILHWTGHEPARDALWAAATAIVLIPLIYTVIRSLLAGDMGVDAIALVAMGAALSLGEYLVGAIIALMMSGGGALEHAAERRARRDLTTLVGRAPRTARLREGDGYREVDVATIVPGDVVLVRGGEIVPVDGLLGADAQLDESALTGEPLPVSRRAGDAVRSGVANAGPPFELRTTRPESESAYAAIVRLVHEAESGKARFLRMADRYAAIFLPLTLVTAGLAWAISGTPHRALAVLVVATPCPLILAAPIALISGMSRAAKAGVILKGSQVVEQLGRARTVLLDKTGTVTTGAPEVRRILPAAGVDERKVLEAAASVEQYSPHVLARALVRAAADRGIAPTIPEDVLDVPGSGIAGTVDGRRIFVGSPDWVASETGIAVTDLEAPREPGDALASVATQSGPLGVVIMGDQLRQDAPQMIQRLRASGVERIALVTGDRSEVGAEVGERIGVDRVHADQSPEDKVAVVRSLLAEPDARPVVMVGDGINDAPALAVADVGVAMAAGGATISSETADAVVLVDRIDGVASAIRSSRRAFGIARQSVLVGLGLSIGAMGFAAAGLLIPIAGALLQEVIDVAVILNALRALRDPAEHVGASAEQALPTAG